MTTKKSNGGEGTGKSQTRKTKTTTPQKRERISSPKSAEPTGIVSRGQSKEEHRISTSEELQREIAKRAYELYERRGWHNGQDLHDWLEAEQEILTQKSLVHP